MAKLNKINKVYDRPLLRLVHYRHLKLKLTVGIYLANGGKGDGLKRHVY